MKRRFSAGKRLFSAALTPTARAYRAGESPPEVYVLGTRTFGDGRRDMAEYNWVNWVYSLLW